jgi:hypothetical protein
MASIEPTPPNSRAPSLCHLDLPRTKPAAAAAQATTATPAAAAPHSAAPPAAGGRSVGVTIALAACQGLTSTRKGLKLIVRFRFEVVISKPVQPIRFGDNLSTSSRWSVVMTCQRVRGVQS